MDDFDINNLVTGFAPGNLPIKTVLFGGIPFADVNGSLPDFFIFEAAGVPLGNPDDISIAAIFPDDSLGQAVTCPERISTPPGTIPGWGNTGLVIVPGSASQVVAGLCWDIADLKNAAGAALTSMTVIKGIAITAGPGIDVLSFLAKVPPILVDHFAVTTSAASTNVGDAFDVTLTAQDSANNTVGSGTMIVSVAAVGSLMEFDWNSDGIYGDNNGTLTAGAKTIKARNLRAETTFIVASSGAFTTTTPPSVTTTALAFSKLQVLAPGEKTAPGTATGKVGAPPYYLVGTPFNVTVNAVDAYWNFISTAPANIIAILSTDNTATLPAPAALALGTQTFSVTFNQRGTFTVTATNTTDALIANGVSASIISALPIVWQGDGSLNNWDILTSANWTNLADAAVTYSDGDVVTFNDTGSATPAVNIVTNVKPSAITVNSSNNYIFSSATGCGIGGSASLRKEGAGMLTLNTSNSYSGGTSVSGAQLVLSNACALPGGGTFSLSNSVVVMAATNLNRSANVYGTTVTFAAAGANRSVNIGNVGWGGGNFFSGSGDFELVLCRATDSCTLDFQSQIDFLSFGGHKIIRVEDGAAAVDAVISGRIQDNVDNPGSLVKTGAGTLQLAHPTSNFTIPTYVEDGTLIITGGSIDSDNAFILGNGATSAVLQLGNASAGYNLTVGSLTTSGTGTGNRVVGGHTTDSTLTVNAAFGDVTFDGILGGPGANQNNLALTKRGIGTALFLSGANTYSGPTTISHGALYLNDSGSISNSVRINVANGAFFCVSDVADGYLLDAAQTLNGGGSVIGNVTANGWIAPGAVTGIDALTFNNDLTLKASAKLVMDIHRTNAPNCDTIVVNGAFTPGGSLIVTNIGPELAMNDRFQLFSTAVSGFSSIKLPTLVPGLTWTNKLAEDGSIALLGPTPTDITFSVSGGDLILNWPVGQGWQLQSQTNSLEVGLKTNWVTVPEAVPPFTNVISSANGSVFYRLVRP